MRHALLPCLLLAACAHAPSPGRGQAEGAPGRARAVEVSPEKAGELYRLLEALGQKPVTVGAVTYLTFYDLACRLDLPAGDTKCEYYTQPPERRGRRPQLVGGKPELEELRAFLHAFPVEQGDPGAVSRFAQCRRYSFTPSIDCYLAIHVNYEGP